MKILFGIFFTLLSLIVILGITEITVEAVNNYNAHNYFDCFGAVLILALIFISLMIIFAKSIREIE